MKNLFKKIALLSFAMIVFGCSKDSVTSSTPCYPIACLNGGISKPDCGCTCPTGFTGANCGTQITPTKITITKIEIKGYPSTDPSAFTGYWDYAPISNPDLAIVIKDLYNSAILTDTSNIPINDALLTTTYTYTYNSFQITNVNDVFSIELRDIDAGSNPSFQHITSKSFSIYSASGGFPSVIPIIDGDTKYNIYVTYTW